MVAANDTRKKRVSKKNKKSWRKNTDTSDVDAFLENVRIEERLGGPTSAKPDDELFRIDTVAAKDEPNRLLSKRERRKITKPLRCFEALRNDSCVPDPIIKRNRIRKAGEGKIPEARKVQQRLRTLRKDIQSLKDHAKTELKRERIKNTKHVTKDLWADEELSVKLPGDVTWLQAPTLVHTVQTYAKKFGHKTDPSRKKNSVLPAIEPPHPGLSYNPSLADHQDLLRKVADNELEVIKQVKHIERVTSDMYGRHSERPTEATRLIEMSEGLPFVTPAGEPAADSEGSDSEYHAANPPVKNRKKSVQQRKKRLAAHKEQLQKQADKVEKKKLSDIYKLRKLDEEIAKEKAEQAKLRELRDKTREKRALEPKQMSRYKYQEPDLDFNMPKDLAGNIRNLKTEGSILKDRFKSLQKRNVIETRVRQTMKRKYKLKKITKNSHKSDLELRAGGLQGLEKELDLALENQKKKGRKNRRQTALKKSAG